MAQQKAISNTNETTRSIACQGQERNLHKSCFPVRLPHFAWRRRRSTFLFVLNQRHKSLHQNQLLFVQCAFLRLRPGVKDIPTNICRSLSSFTLRPNPRIDSYTFSRCTSIFSVCNCLSFVIDSTVFFLFPQFHPIFFPFRTFSSPFQRRSLSFPKLPCSFLLHFTCQINNRSVYLSET